MAVIAVIALFAGVFYLGTRGNGGRAAGPPPGVVQMKVSEQNRDNIVPPAAAAYVPPGAPVGVRQMIGQSRGGGVSVPPAPAAYVPPGAPTGVKQMINQTRGSATPGMMPPGQ
jgi:hypothetical protein